MEAMTVASRGRGPNNRQHFEANPSLCSNTITHVLKDNLLLCFPHRDSILSKVRSEEGKAIRRLYKNDIGVPYQAVKAYAVNDSGICGTVTTFTTDNNIIEHMTTSTNQTSLPYKPNPTKQDLLEYFSSRIRIRKMTEKEALRLMDVSDSDIAKIRAAGIAKTHQYKLAGNSIVVSCLYHIFRRMFVDKHSAQPFQTSLFDNL